MDGDDIPAGDVPLLAGVLRRFVAEGYNWVQLRDDPIFPGISLDGEIDVTPEQAAAVRRLLDGVPR